MMSDSVRVVRVFISSPGDVADERDKARRVIDTLQKRYPAVRLVPLLWEELALPATASFQESIDFLLDREPIDVAVFILWTRLGSPLGAATVRADGRPYRSGTEREFDLMLEAFERSGRRRPVILAYAREDDAGFRVALTDCPGERLEDMIAQRRLVDSFIREQFYDGEGRNVRALRSYREPVSFAQQLHLHLRQVLDNLLTADETPRWLDEPYRGLKAFDLEHAAVFQGRDEETADLLQRLRDRKQAGCAFVVIVGASGSGKSSLARAGVAASLLELSFDDGVKEWKVVPIVPGLSGGDLCASLARGLSQALPELTVSPQWLSLISAGLAKDPVLTVNLSLLPALAAREDVTGGTTRVLFLLDQLEELWTDPRISAIQRDRFLDAVEALAQCPHFAVLATLRSDFYPQAQLSPTFLRMKAERGHFDLLPPGPSSLQRLIVEPARLAGLRFERDDRSGRALDELLLQDAASDPGSLPLLQYTLSELYVQRDQAKRMLTLSAYDALGGVDGAIGKRAAETFQSLSSAAKAALPEILPQLVTIDTAGEQAAVRRRAPLSDLRATPARQELTDSLIAARFLSTDRLGEFIFASLTHEALLRRWTQLSEWVAANRDHLRMRAAVEQSQKRWEQQDHKQDLLLSEGLPLEEGRQLLLHAPEILSSGTQAYIQSSVTHHEAQARRRRQLRRATFAAMSVLTILALGGSVFAWQQWTVSRLANEQLVKNNADLEDAKTSLTKTNASLESTQQNLKREVERADRETRLARREQARQFTARAWRLFDDSDPEGCFTLLGEALRLSAGDPEEEPLAQARFSHMWRRFPILGFWNDARCAAFRPDGKEFALGETSGLISIWEADGRRLRMHLDGGMSPVIHLAYNADGSQLVSSEFDGAITTSILTTERYCENCISRLKSNPIKPGL